MTIIDTDRLSEEMYRRLALTEPDRKWELHDGRVREKPPMTWDHNRLGFRLAFLLQLQLSWEAFVVGVDGGRVRRSATRVYIPDVFVAPIAAAASLRGRSDVLEVYDGPLLLIVEAWSPSTGDYDVNEKLAEYQRRGDLEIWLLQPYHRTLTIWRRRPDGGYDESLHREGVVRPASLPGVTIDLDDLFAVLG